MAKWCQMLLACGLVAFASATERMPPPGHLNLPPGFASERAALLTLFEGTNGSGWAENGGWNSTSDHCGWFGVACDRHGRVIQVTLDSNQLVGTLPAEIGQIDSMVMMRLSHNSIDGSIPEAYTSLLNLRSLELQFNKLTGTLPEVDTWQRMVHLNLDHNSLSGSLPTSLGSLQELGALFVEQNRFSGTVHPSLGALKLFGCRAMINNFDCPIPASWVYRGCVATTLDCL